MPSPEEIAERAAEVRARWDRRTERFRAGNYRNDSPAILPTAKLSDLGIKRPIVEAVTAADFET
jgi:hypothetical protein